MKFRLLKRLLRAFSGTALLFSAIVAIGTSLLLLLSSSLGYLPYSDRPGPGWWTKPHWPPRAEITTYAGLVPWFAWYSLFFGLGLFGFSLVLGVASTPRWLNRVLGALIAAISAGIAILGAGWYFAIAAFVPDGAIILGLLYGALLFPRFITPRDKLLPLWARGGLAAVSTAAFLLWLISPFLPRTPTPSINFDLVRVIPGNQPLAVASFEGPEVSRAVAALNLRGESHGGISGGNGQRSGINVELIAFESITKSATLAIPRAGYVVYVLKQAHWAAYPAITEKDNRTLMIKPGSDPQYDGAQLKLSDEKSFHTFTWYPTIPKGQ